MHKIFNVDIYPHNNLTTRVELKITIADDKDGGDVNVMAAKLGCGIRDYLKKREFDSKKSRIYIDGKEAIILKGYDLESDKKYINGSPYVRYIIVGNTYANTNILEVNSPDLFKPDRRMFRVEVKDAKLLELLKSNNGICLCDLEKKCCCAAFKEKDICECGVFEKIYY